MRTLITTAFLITLAAGASVDTKFNLADIDALKPGPPSEHEAIATIGMTCNINS